MYFDLSNIELTDKEISALLSIGKGNKRIENEVILSLAAHGLVTKDLPQHCSVTLRGRRFIDLYASRDKREKAINFRANLALLISFFALLSSWKEEILLLLRKLLQVLT